MLDSLSSKCKSNKRRKEKPELKMFNKKKREKKEKNLMARDTSELEMLKKRKMIPKCTLDFLTVAQSCCNRDRKLTGVLFPDFAKSSV